MNLILRNCLAKLNMVMMRRNYYDAGAKEDVPVYIQNLCQTNVD
jgi:hypothetical protein